ncbi:hypothetical protein MKW94_017694 [Papaver nudicaule]|uniref:Uncharacterized protein n=1 Tax=Papaver nudicaule TaxID=74823 RepID=A0AA42AYJ5_PAPNU|nr:hypothetical protein [Papaver nudicaule]
MRAPNYTLDEDLALVQAYIDFGGDGAIGVQQKKGKLWAKIIPYFIEKTKNPHKRNKHSLQNRLLIIRKETRNFVCLMGKFYRKKVSGWSPEDLAHQARIEYLRLYRKPFPHEETYKLFKYVKGFDYTKCTNEEEEEIPVAPIPTVYVDGEKEEEEEEEGNGGEEENEEKADDEEIPVPPIHPPYKPTPVVDFEEQQKEDERNKRARGIKHNKKLKKAKYTNDENSSFSSIDSIFSQSSDKIISYFKEKDAERAITSQQENDIIERRLKAEQERRVHDLMTMDMSKLSATQRAWVEKQQQQEMEKNG